MSRINLDAAISTLITDAEASISSTDVRSAFAAIADYAETQPGSAGADGLGFTGGSYDVATGTVTFTSDDGLGFSTGDLRGVEGTDGTNGVDGQSVIITATTDQTVYDTATPNALELVVLYSA